MQNPDDPTAPPPPADDACAERPDVAPPAAADDDDDAVADDAAADTEARDDETRPDVEALVLGALAAGPATTHEIARRVDDEWPGVLGAREGYLLPLLLATRRAGRTAARWADRDDGRRRVHSLPGADNAAADAPAAAASLRAARRPATDEMRRVAEACAAKLAFAPRLAEEVRAEVAAHLSDDAAAREADGAAPDAAESAAIRALGDPWKIATDLSRVARGRRAVIFPRTAGETLLSLVLYDAGILVAVVATIVFVRWQVVAAYHIPTKSMEPTLHGDRADGDKILVLSLSPPPRRFDLQVFEGWGTERRQYVKRCVGLPGEDVRIRAGDLVVDGRLVRKEGSDLDAMLFPLFDAEVEREAAARENRTAAARFQDRWDWEGGTKWHQWPDGAFEAETADGARPAVLVWRDRLTDALYDTATGALDPGIEDVADGRLTLDVTPLDESARVTVRWTRGAERFDAVLRGAEPGAALLADGAELARAEDVKLPVGRTARVRVSHVDRVLRVEVDGDVVIRRELPEPSAAGRTGPGAEVTVRVERGKVRLLPVRVERDVHWTSEYESTPRDRLGPDDFFMLGDNSSNSHDSRARGPVHRSRLVGEPILIVWPLSRVRVPR